MRSVSFRSLVVKILGNLKMKKIWMMSFLLLGLIGCSTNPAPKQTDYRSPNSENFSCRFNSIVAGSDVEFEFIPEENQLLIKSSGGSTSLALIESDFSEGGFVFKHQTSTWDLNLVFTSFKTSPHVKILFKKSPWSKTPLVVEQSCSKTAE